MSRSVFGPGVLREWQWWQLIAPAYTNPSQSAVMIL